MHYLEKDSCAVKPEMPLRRKVKSSRSAAVRRLRPREAEGSGGGEGLGKEAEIRSPAAEPKPTKELSQMLHGNLWPPSSMPIDQAKT